MNKTNKSDEYHLMHDVLEKKSYSKLLIKRFEHRCYLLIYNENSAHIYTDNNGKRKEYRHAWQIREWLQEKFGIDANEIQVEKI
ncbi:MAG TPA: hypothetical protein DCX54_08015 [Flavobacteriales bacterium]|nr:hypothetical protein [Flavobacteriales bacterium]